MKKRLFFIILLVLTFCVLVNPVSVKASDNLYGVDISEHNPNVDFTSLKANGISFAILRLGYGEYYYGTSTKRNVVNDDIQMDKLLETYTAQARNSGMPILGYYLYSYAETVEDANAEADHALYLLNRVGADKNSYVIFDVEQYNDASKKQVLTDSAVTFLEKVRQAGYKPMLYTGYNYYYNNLDGERLKQYDKWIAHYGAREGRETINSEQVLLERDSSLYNRLRQIPNVKIWQFSSTAQLNGSNGYVDMNLLLDSSDAFNALPLDTSVVKEGSKMYRLYNPNSGEHFYTKAEAEAKYLIKKGWSYEGVAWIAPDKGDEVHRLYNPNSGDHHYTPNKDESDKLVQLGWRYEGVSWYSAGKRPLYRLYNPNAKGAGSHHYTLEKGESDQLVKLGWKYEGIAWSTPY